MRGQRDAHIKKSHPDKPAIQGTGIGERIERIKKIPKKKKEMPRL